MPRFLVAVLALVTLAACGNAKKNEFETEMKFYRQAESALLIKGCTLLEKSAEEISLECPNVTKDSSTGSLENTLRDYVTRGATVLEKDGAGEKKFLTEDERVRIQRKIALANKIRGAIPTR